MKAENNNHKRLISSPPFILKAGRSLTTLILLGLAVHLILPQLASFEASLQVIKTMALWAVLLAALSHGNELCRNRLSPVFGCGNSRPATLSV